MAKKGKTSIKKWVFRGKKRVIRVKKYELATKIERQNGAKRTQNS
mgnify:CR=1 FL=1